MYDKEGATHTFVFRHGGMYISRNTHHKCNNNRNSTMYSHSKGQLRTV